MRDVFHINSVIKGVSITISVSPEIPETIVTDPKRLRQVLLNLVNNAMKFTYEGCIRITIKSPSEKTYKISVLDTGIGISSHSLSKLRGSENDEIQIKPTASGLGLGLPICKRLVR